MKKLPVEFAKILYLRFTSIYGERFTRPHSSDQLVQMWWEDWSDGLFCIKSEHIKDALNYCKLNFDWPPSLSEFRKLCERASGLPSCDEAFLLAIRNEFNHPIVKMAYDKVGSWSMRNDKETLVRNKFNKAYQDSLNQYRENQKKEIRLIEKQDNNNRINYNDENKAIDRRSSLIECYEDHESSDSLIGLKIKDLRHESHGSENERNYTRANGVRKIESMLL